MVVEGTISFLTRNKKLKKIDAYENGRTRSVTLRQGLNFVAGCSTGLGSGILHTTIHQGADGSPCYDFIYVEVLVDKPDSIAAIGTKRRRNQSVGSPVQHSDEDEDIELVTLLAQLICIIMIEYADQRRPPEYYAIVQYLKKQEGEMTAVHSIR